MFVFVIALVIALCFAVLGWRRTRRNKAEFERHSISAQELHDSMAGDRKVLLFDVRQPLDLLAYPEQIPGAQRIPPEEVLANPKLIPKDRDVVVYCTCPSDKTSRMVMRRAMALGLSRIKFLTGGLAAWKGMGFPVEPYTGTFALSSAASMLPKA